MNGLKIHCLRCLKVYRVEFPAKRRYESPDFIEFGKKRPPIARIEKLGSYDGKLISYKCPSIEKKYIKPNATKKSRIPISRYK
jgi:hypothetical protein